VVGSRFNGSIYKEILPDTRSLLLDDNFPNMINLTQIVRPSQPVAYSFPSPFTIFRLVKEKEGKKGYYKDSFQEIYCSSPK